MWALDQSLCQEWHPKNRAKQLLRIASGDDMHIQSRMLADLHSAVCKLNDSDSAIYYTLSLLCCPICAKKAICRLRDAPCNSLDHGLDQVVDEVLPVAVVATLDVMQPLLVHATLCGKTHQTISQSWQYKLFVTNIKQAVHITYTTCAIKRHSGVM